MILKEIKCCFLRFTAMVCFLGLLNLTSMAQPGKQTVEIVSEYQPVFREASKLNFTPLPLPPVEEKMQFNYRLPVYPLNLQLVPAALRAVPTSTDSTDLTHRQDYVKIGYGNLRSPYAAAGLRFGNREFLYGSIHAEHFSQKGDLRAQRFSHSKLTGNLSLQGSKHVLDGVVGYRRQVFGLYANDPVFISAKEDSLRKPYQTVDMNISWRNKNAAESGIGYQPKLSASLFNDGISTEKNLRLQIPVNLNFGTDYAFILNGDLDFTFFNPAGFNSYTNHIYAIKGAFEVRKPGFILQAGVMPLSSASRFHLLPAVYTEFKVKQDQLHFIAAWEGAIQKNNYTSLTAFNPWINQPQTQFNTRVQDIYAGIKGRVLNNTLYFQFQFGLQQLRDQALFENSIRPGLFEVRKERRLNSLQTKGVLHYRIDDKLQIHASAQINNFFGQQSESAPWHLLPVQVKGGLTWKPAERFKITAECLAWRGGVYKRNITGDKGRLPSVIDLNTGAEFRVKDGIFTWIQFSNLLNTNYQRWYQYPVFGFQVHGGIKLTFDAKL